MCLALGKTAYYSLCSIGAGIPCNDTVFESCRCVGLVAHPTNTIQVAEAYGLSIFAELTISFSKVTLTLL